MKPMRPARLVIPAPEALRRRREGSLTGFELTESRAEDDGLDHEILSGLREMATDGGAEVLSELVEMFLHDAGTLIQALRAAAASGDRSELSSISHALRGSAGSLGARRLAAGASDLETRAASHLTDGAAAAVDGLERELQHVRVALPRALGVSAA